MEARGVQVWQQKKNIPKDSDDWFPEWYPSANVSIKIVCFLTAAYLKSIYCMKEFRVAAAMPSHGFHQVRPDKKSAGEMTCRRRWDEALAMV